MTFKTDVQISQEAKMVPIAEIAKNLKLAEEEYEVYGKYKAKISTDILKNRKSKYQYFKKLINKYTWFFFKHNYLILYI